LTARFRDGPLALLFSAIVARITDGSKTRALILAFGTAAAIGLRLFLADRPGFIGDGDIFRAWSRALATGQPWHFYDSISSSDYAPGYLYVLWAFGELDRVLHFDAGQWNFLLKTPAIVADLASAWLLYRLLEKRGAATQLATTLIYLFFPPALLIGAFWGQVDSVLAFFLLLTVYFLANDRPVAGATAFMLGFLVKPQAAAALPFLAFWILRQRPLQMDNGLPRVPKVWFECVLIPLLFLILLVTPFFPDEPWRFLTVLDHAANIDRYRVNSFWAFNFWSTGGMLNMGLHCDLPGRCAAGSAAATTFLGVPARYWGLGMFVAAIATIVGLLRNAKGTGYLALGTALSVMAFYLLLTRMHERYAFAAFLPLLLACAALKGRVLWGAFSLTASLHFANLYYVFGVNYLFNEKGRSMYPDYVRWSPLYRWLGGHTNVPLIGHVETVQVLSVLFVAAFALLLSNAGYLAHQSATRPGDQERRYPRTDLWDVPSCQSTRSGRVRTSPGLSRCVGPCTLGASVCPENRDP